MSVRVAIRVVKKLLDKLDKYQAAKTKLEQQFVKTGLLPASRVDVIVPASITGTGRPEIRNMKSSWVKAFVYDNLTQRLFMTVYRSKKVYVWENIDPVIAWNCIRGNATCTTDDRKKRWWKGKNPSLGAAYWQYLAGARKGVKKQMKAKKITYMSVAATTPMTKVATRKIAYLNAAATNPMQAALTRAAGRPSKAAKRAKFQLLQEQYGTLKNVPSRSF